MDVLNEKNKVGSEKDFYTPYDVKELLDLSMNTIYRLFRKKNFPSFKIGNNFFIKKEDFEYWIDKQKRIK